jgi:hypothetical protein
VKECSSAECPVSLLTRPDSPFPEAIRLTEILTSDRIVKNGTGAVMFGPDSGKWKAVWFDLVTIFSRYLNLEQIAEHEAFRQEMDNK